MEENIDPLDNIRSTHQYQSLASNQRYMAVAYVLQKEASTTNCKIVRIVRTNLQLDPPALINPNALTSVNMLAMWCYNQQISPRSYDSYFAQACSIKNQSSSSVPSDRYFYMPQDTDVWNQDQSDLREINVFTINRYTTDSDFNDSGFWRLLYQGV